MVKVIKSSGEIQEFNAEKINKVINWACSDLDVSESEIAMKAHIQVYDGITTNQIHDMLIKSASDLISVEHPDYQYAAARLLLFKLRKEVYGDFDPPALYDHIQEITELGWYDEHILQDYTENEINYLETIIQHERDFDYTYVAMKQYQEKYLVKNRVTGEIFETPQMAIMLIAMCLHSKETEDRLIKVTNFYNAVSNMEISLPTPIMAGVRTPTRQFSSCVLIEAGDDIDQIFNASAAQGKYAAQRAGIGVNVGGIRGVGAPIRGGEVSHAGLVPIIRMFQESLGWASQGGVRKASATYYYPVWHYDFEQLIVLKNNRGTEETRARHVDYGVQLSKLFYQRLLENKNITFFHPNVAGGELYESFFTDQDRFIQLYETLEKDKQIKKKSLPASEVFKMIATERAQTGRIYIQNIDHCNTNSPFKSHIAPIKQSNLCVTPETKILTDKGYLKIGDLEGKFINVWNGEEFSNTQIHKTGENQKIIKIITDSGYELECTPYHKFYIQKGYKRGTGDNKFEIKEIEAKNLMKGHKLIKFNLPVIEGKDTLELAYENGFYSGDGCYISDKEQRVYLYHDKRKLINSFRGTPRINIQEKEKRILLTYTKLKDKYFVPNNTFTIKSRLEWLAGFADADGTVLRNGKTQSISLSNSNKEFLKEIQLMLQTLGIESKVRDARDEGYLNLPLNNGTNEYGLFLCKKIYRLTINTFEMNKLIQMGINFNRLQFINSVPNRSANHFIKIVSVIDEERISDTYCFTEPKKHMGMFNGILTGQCAEIALPTQPINDIMQSEQGEIALCTLLAFNLGKIKSNSDLERLSDISVRALDNLLDYQNYPVKAAEKNKFRRSLGIGWTNLAYYLAARGLNYSSGNGNNTIHELAEAFQFYLLKASNNLAKERGQCEYFNETSYSQGILPIDRYKKEIDNYHTTVLKMDWESLRSDIQKFGLRNSTLSALMPCETSSQITNSTNGIEPPRAALSIKASGDGSFRQLVPEVTELQNNYEYKWQMKSPRGYLTFCGLIQKFIDQSISANTFYCPWEQKNGKLTLETILQDILYAYSIGMKTLYYQETKDNEGEDNSFKEDKIESTEEDCESCKI